MNLNHIVQQYKKLQTLEDYFNYKFDPRTKKKIRRQYQNADMIIPDKQFERNIDEKELINDIESTDNVVIKNRNRNIVTTSEAMNDPSFNKKENSNSEHISKEETKYKDKLTQTQTKLNNLSIRKRNNKNNNNYVLNIFNPLITPKTPSTSKESYRKNGTSSYFYQKSNNSNNEVKRTRTTRLCEEVRELEVKNHLRISPSEEKKQFINEINKKYSKSMQCVVNNFPNIAIGTYGQVSSIGGIQVNYDKNVLNKKLKEEFMEYNERIIPIKIRHDSSKENSKERYKVREIYREEFDAQPYYYVTKPLVPSIRARIHSNMKSRKKSPYKIVYSNINNQFRIVDDKNKRIDFCIKGNNELY